MHNIYVKYMRQVAVLTYTICTISYNRNNHSVYIYCRSTATAAAMVPRQHTGTARRRKRQRFHFSYLFFNIFTPPPPKNLWRLPSGRTPPPRLITLAIQQINAFCYLGSLITNRNQSTAEGSSEGQIHMDISTAFILQ